MIINSDLLAREFHPFIPALEEMILPYYINAIKSQTHQLSKPCEQGWRRLWVLNSGSIYQRKFPLQPQNSYIFLVKGPAGKHLTVLLFIVAIVKIQSQHSKVNGDIRYMLAGERRRLNGHSDLRVELVLSGILAAQTYSMVSDGEEVRCESYVI